MWFAKKTFRNGVQFPFMKKGFPEINVRGFLETTPENVTMRKPERTVQGRGISHEPVLGKGDHSEVWKAGLLVSFPQPKRHEHPSPSGADACPLSSPRSVKQAVKSLGGRFPAPSP